MRPWLKWVLGIFATLVLLAVGFLVAFDWNWARGAAVDYASKKAGREIRVADLKAEWSLRPTISLRDVYIANAEWAEAGALFSAELLEVKVDLPELLRGRTVLPEIKLVKPDIALQVDMDGTPNWDLDTEAADQAVTPKDRTEAPLIGRLSIEDGRIRYKDIKRSLNIDGQIRTVEATGGEGTGQVELNGQGVLQGERFEIRFLGGSLLSLREAKERYPLTLDLKAVDTHGTISGTLADPIKFDGLDLKVRLSGPNLAKLTKITGVPLPLTPKYDLAGRLERDEKVWGLTGIDGLMGRSDLQGLLKIDLGKERLYLEADLTSKRLDYRDVGFLIGVPIPLEEAGQDTQQTAARALQGGQESADKSAKKSADKDDEAARGQGDRVDNDGNQPREHKRVLPDAPLSANQVRETDARVKFKGEKVEAPNAPLSGVELDLEMLNGVLHLKPLTVGVAGGTAIADIRIDAQDEPIKTDYDIKLKAFELQEFLGRAGMPKAGRGRIDGRIKLAGWGATVSRSLGNSDGDIRLVINEGEISHIMVELVGLDIAESLGLFMGDRNKIVPIRCMVTDLGVQNGVVSPRVFLLDTTDTTIAVEGAADFRTELIDLAIKAYPKDPSPISLRTPITVRGSFSEPHVGIQKAALGARGAAAIALGVLLTPFASILAFIEPGMSPDSDCAKLLNRVQAPAHEETPNKVQAPEEPR